MPCFLNVNLGAEYSKRFVFVRVFVKKIPLPIDNLHVAVCSFCIHAINLEYSIGHDSFNSN